MASFKAPENGILLYGGYVADKWVAISVAEKLKPGGELRSFSQNRHHRSTRLGTDCPGYSSGLHRYAQGGGNRRHQNNEHADSRCYYGSQPHSGADGKRRIIITPKVPASQIFAPGLPVQVTIKDQQA